MCSFYIETVVQVVAAGHAVVIIVTVGEIDGKSNFHFHLFVEFLITVLVLFVALLLEHSRLHFLCRHKGFLL